MTFASLEDTISTDNPIRFIDAFVENVGLWTLGFEVNLGFISNFFMWAKKTSWFYCTKKEDYKSSW